MSIEIEQAGGMNLEVDSKVP